MKKYTPHLGHVSVIEACEQTGCPICSLSHKSVTLYLQMVLADYVDAPELRQQLCSTWGYCRKHAWQLPDVERGNLLTVAIMYQDIFEREYRVALEQMRKKSGGGLRGVFQKFSKKKSAVPEAAQSPSCPACELAAEVDMNAIKILLDGLVKKDAKMHHALTTSDGLCFPHLNQAVELAPNADVRDTLLTIMQDKFAAIQHELSEFIRKHDYRFQHETIGDEKFSWRRAINFIVGSE